MSIPNSLTIPSPWQIFLNDSFPFPTRAADKTGSGGKTMTNTGSRFWKLLGAKGQFRNLLCC